MLNCKKRMWRVVTQFSKYRVICQFENRKCTWNGMDRLFIGLYVYVKCGMTLKQFKPTFQSQCISKDSELFLRLVSNETEGNVLRWINFLLCNRQEITKCTDFDFFSRIYLGFLTVIHVTYCAIQIDKLNSLLEMVFAFVHFI